MERVMYVEKVPKRYIVSQMITYQTVIIAESEEEAHDMFLEMGLATVPIVNTSDVDVLAEQEGKG